MKRVTQKKLSGCMSTDELQAYLKERYGLKYARQTLISYRATGSGPIFFKLVGKLWYRQEDVDAWVASAQVFQHGDSSKAVKTGR